VVTKNHPDLWKKNTQATTSGSSSYPILFAAARGLPAPLWMARAGVGKAGKVKDRSFSM